MVLTLEAGLLWGERKVNQSGSTLALAGMDVQMGHALLGIGLCPVGRQADAY